MEPHYRDESVTLYHGDCLDVLRGLPDCSVDSVVCDPPYGLANTDPAQVADTIIRWVNGERDYLPGGKGFMGKAWDAFVPPVAVWDDCLRVLKPGGHVLAFAGSRTMDLMTLSLRLAGFEIRDSIAWLYGSGFPKSLDVSKAIDKAAGAEREIVGTTVRPRGISTPLMSAARCEQCGLTRNGTSCQCAPDSGPATPAAEQWQGWGTALKPAFEPVVVARKPLAGTVAANVLAHGVGALNIDGCRVATAETLGRAKGGWGNAAVGADNYGNFNSLGVTVEGGRWPANVVLDESQAALLDEQSGTQRDGVAVNRNKDPEAHSGNVVYGAYRNGSRDDVTYGSGGGASRFFYVAKAPTRERPKVDGVAHPTVKPLTLMRWLVRLVTPPGGTVLEPFAGSGTTVEAAILEGFHCVAIEREADYLPLIEARLARVAGTVEAEPAVPSLFDMEETA